MALVTRILNGIDEIKPAQWNAVLPRGTAPVMRWEWLNALESSGSATAERGWEPRHLTAWRQDTLIGVAPAWRKHHSMGEYVYDFSWANAAESMGLRYYPKFLVGVPLSPLTTTRFVAAPGESISDVRAALVKAAVDEAHASRCSSVHVIFPPEEEAAALAALPGFFGRSSMQYHWRNANYRSYDDYLARFDSKRRNQLRRERNAAATQGITLRTVRSSELDKAHAELAWRFYEATAARHAWGPVQLTRDFFHRAFAAMPEAIELVVAEREGRVIAGAFNLHTETHLYGRYWGCFEEHPFLHFHVCLYHSIDDCIQRGLEVFEPGAGGEHKVSRGFVPTRIHSVHQVFDAKLSRAIEAFCQREAREVGRVVSDGETIAGLKPST